MTRHLHETANAVLYRALDLPTADRQQFIAQATAGDLDLFEDVRTMLSRIEQLDQFLEDPLELPVEVKPPVPVVPRHGDLVGQWRIEHELGRNGADLILLVRGEAGGAFAGEAASMRLAQTASRTGATTTRFERLRERLATLDHPAIPAPVDGGVTADGRPYFVVRRGAGVAIDRYCAEQRLDLAARATLFARVCDAVHYMHQHLIVHRDLKPADMLVDQDGVTLLDVGMIGDGWPVNPAYASPDQLAGQPLSVSSDIYSLGAVLYSLLSGRLAHRADSHGVIGSDAGAHILPASEAVREALARDLPVPADLPEDAVLRPGEALAQTLHSHFDAILARALAPQPAARYASAHALARDLEQAAARLNAPALPAADDAVDVDVDVADAAAPSLEEAGVREAALIAPSRDTAAAATAPESAAESAAEPGTGLPTEAVSEPAPPRRRPVALAVAMLAVGFAAGVLAAPWLQQQDFYKKAMAPAVSAPAAAKTGAAAAAPAAVATAATETTFAAALAQADSARAAGDLAGAERAAREALRLVEREPQAARDRAGPDANLRLGTILAEQGKTADGLVALRRALALHESHAVMDNGGAVSARAGAEVHRAIAEVLAGSGDDAGAEAELTAARAVYMAQLKTTPNDAGLQAGLLAIELARATAQNAQKHGRDTVATLATLRRLAGPRGDARIDLLEAYVQPRGTAERAYAAAQPALAALKQSNGDPLDPAQARVLARAYTMTGEIALRAKQNGAACGDFAEAGRVYESLSSANRLNAYDKLAVQRLDGFRQGCK